MTVEEARKGSAENSVDNADALIAQVVAEMGLEPDKPARWRQRWYFSHNTVVGGYRPDGWTCSRCGIYSCVKKETCPGCGAKMDGGKTE